VQEGGGGPSAGRDGEGFVPDLAGSPLALLGRA
jgi:hypothetical protein